MAGQTIYPSIPSPGNTIQTILPCIDAMRQTLNMIIINAQAPSPNYAPSSAAQIFATKGYVDGRTPITSDAPADGHKYVRQNGVWVPE